MADGGWNGPVARAVSVAIHAAFPPDGRYSGGAGKPVVLYSQRHLYQFVHTLSAEAGTNETP